MTAGALAVGRHREPGDRRLPELRLGIRRQYRSYHTGAPAPWLVRGGGLRAARHAAPARERDRAEAGRR